MGINTGCKCQHESAHRLGATYKSIICRHNIFIAYIKLVAISYLSTKNAANKRHKTYSYYHNDKRYVDKIILIGKLNTCIALCS